MFKHCKSNYECRNKNSWIRRFIDGDEFKANINYSAHRVFCKGEIHQRTSSFELFSINLNIVSYLANTSVQT